MSKEAMKLALEALELCNGAQTAEGVVVYTDKEITALREALAEPQEKYTYGTPLLDAMTGKANEALDKMAENARELGLDYEPAQQEPFGYFKAEPFGWTDCAESDEGAVALYERPQPAQRTWVGLTDEEILAANYPDGEENGPTISAPDFELDCFAKQVEAKLKEKNT